MTSGVCCPQCGQAAQERGGCRHLRWVPRRGNPIDFAKSVVASRPFAEDKSFTVSSIPQEWWEAQFDWLMDCIEMRFDVIDGYCFGDAVDLDLLRLDIWHRFAPQPERAGPGRTPEGESLARSAFVGNLPETDGNDSRQDQAQKSLP